MLQLLFCVETNKKSNTDYVYIKETINEYYDYDRNKISFKPVFMESKTKYKSNKVINSIKAYQQNKDIRSIVIYCIDLDKLDLSPEDQERFMDIQSYCAQKGYEIVWFSRDVEEVFWHKRIDPKEKVRYASNFRAHSLIKKINPEVLAGNDHKQKQTSNILSILDKFLTRKKNV